MTKFVTYDEAYKIARRKLHQALGEKIVLIVKNEKGNFRAYYQNEYQCKRKYFPILIKTL